jgi:hypothetical protein
MSISKLNVHFARSSLQGGASNDEFPSSYFYDYRLMHHHYTLLALAWKGFTRTEGDTKFHDAVSGTQKAEGKKLSPRDGVCFAPSVETGAGRSATRENILKCFDTNDFYFLYSTLHVDDEKVIGAIYWVPTSLIRVWFDEVGTKSGSICYAKFMKKMETVDVQEEPVIMRRGFPV